MAGEWRKLPLGKVATLQRGFDLPVQDRQPGSVPIISSSGPTGTHAEAKVMGPGVVTGRYGTIGEVFYIEEDFWPLNTTLWVKDFHGNLPRYIYYLLKTIDFTQFNDKSSVPGVNRNHLHTLTVHVPPLETQKAIAHILDDKIELNRRMNRTLEEMSRALFKSWFMDFDPVRAKMEGRQPEGMDAETAALFPDGLEDSELGEIPRGWQITSVGEVARVIKGRSYKSDELSDSDTALVTLKSFQRGGGYRTDGLKPFTGIYKPEQEVVPGELVIAFTDVTQAAEVIGKPAIVLAEPRFQRLVASLDVGIIRPMDEQVSTSFLYALFSAEDYQSHIYGYTSGTTVLHLSKDGILSYRFALPPLRVMKRYAEISSATLAKIAQNELESRTLAALRDILLPKLLSGDLSINAASVIVEGVK
ncbi:Type-1 restriction enzyme EcoKI specificity protein [Calidithermus terrae]|uniref:Type-1 restriction enzyme EcoKI specificity protein n=1 Tax=Calidithermus terrae TaxID=1408545 RepID=A0A399ERS1_9DEIN|nr:restriction endonuclease subunit S [Calidithermus terrae]RIH85262.1 Type-1 restriction enzyme EcoKI specificity protein [Calidithermus terrae]